MGKPRDPLATRLHDVYAARLEQLGVRYESLQVADVRPGGRFTTEHALEREAAALTERLDDKGTVVALDERGELLSSRALAEVVESWATPRLTLVVGGPSGLHRRVVERADRCWSLSPLTFPHELVRGLVLEQLYRALTIRRGMPYHK